MRRTECPCPHVRTREMPVVYQKHPGILGSTQENVQHPFLYKNILFKRRFKNKNSVQHWEVLLFVSGNKTALRKRALVAWVLRTTFPCRRDPKLSRPGPGQQPAAPLPSGAVCSEKERRLARVCGIEVCGPSHKSRGIPHRPRAFFCPRTRPIESPNIAQRLWLCGSERLSRLCRSLSS